MTTAAERLVALSGSGDTSAAARLRRIGLVGATAGALLVAYSGLASATAAEHLLVDRQVVEQAPTQVIGAGRGRRDEPTVEQVIEKWEFIEGVRRADAERRQAALHPAPDLQAGAASTIDSTNPRRALDEDSATARRPPAPADLPDLAKARAAESALMLTAVLQAVDGVTFSGAAMTDEELAIVTMLLQGWQPVGSST